MVWCLGLPPANPTGNGCWDWCRAVWKLGVEANVPKKDVVLGEVIIQSAGAEELRIGIVEEWSFKGKDDELLENGGICFDVDTGCNGAAMGKSWVMVFESDEAWEVFCKKSIT